ncbi:class I SAM-dependent methyltransferase [Mangrovimicrobium sediminis]|nr:class I SAM-dependent methyltransferase [Haliea sp. SAOS-164]
MIALWGQVILPLVEAVDGKHVLEIGAEFGLSTQALVNFARRVDGHVHCIDPAPIFDVEEFEAQYGGRLSFYKDTSLNAIPKIPEVDVVLVDGDHNWYTVYHELKLIEAHSDHDALKLPLIFVHDTAWPYGRRDLYYDPASIPEEFRHPYAMQGMGRQKRELMPEGGINADMNNALVEGGERNGVLTAVEDYIRESSLDFEFLNLPLYFGLGILISRERLDSNPALAAEMQKLHGMMQGEKLITITEKLRMNLTGIVQRMQREQAASQARVEELERELAQLRGG